MKGILHFFPTIVKTLGFVENTQSDSMLVYILCVLLVDLVCGQEYNFLKNSIIAIHAKDPGDHFTRTRMR